MKFKISYNSNTEKIKYSLLNKLYKIIQKSLLVFFPVKQQTTIVMIKNKGWIDEIFIGNWFHLESLDRFLWFVSIGDISFNVNTKIKSNININCEIDDMNGELMKNMDKNIYNDNVKYNIRLINNPHGFITDEKGTLIEITIERWFRITAKENHNWDISAGDYNFQVNTIENKVSVTKINKNEDGRV